MRPQPEPSCELAVRVTPRSSRNKIVVDGDLVRVWITAAPTDGQANEAGCALIATALRIAPSRVSIKRGHVGRQKVVLVEGEDHGTAMGRLAGI